jgi:fructokinase
MHYEYMTLRIGIDLGGTKIEGIALAGSREVARLRVPTPRDDYDATLDAIVSLTIELENLAGGSGTVGIGIPGAIAPSTGLVKNANSVWLIGRPLGDDLSARWRVRSASPTTRTASRCRRRPTARPPGQPSCSV